MAGHQSAVDLSTPEAQAEVLELAAKAEAAHEAGLPDTSVAPAETPAETVAPEAAAPTGEGTEGTKSLEIAEADASEITDGLDMEALGQEYAEHGALGDESRTTILEALRPKFGTASENVLNSYLAGIDAQVSQAHNVAYDAAGGKDQLEAMSEWAAEGLSEAQKSAYNQAVNTPGFVQMAVRDLRAQYEAANGTVPAAAPDRVAAPAVTPAAPGGTEPITSMQQLSKVVTSEKYLTDPGYRASVDAQVAAATKAGRV
ncbi:MAG: hypothetical protein V3S01_06980 [Dehalococcoidia bacterium]